MDLANRITTKHPRRGMCLVFFKKKIDCVVDCLTRAQEVADHGFGVCTFVVINFLHCCTTTCTTTTTTVVSIGCHGNKSTGKDNDFHPRRLECGEIFSGGQILC